MFNEKTWKDGEKLAQNYMKEKGFKIKYTNFKAGGVELDIVAVLTKKEQLKSLKEDTKKKLKNAPTQGMKDSLIQRSKALENELTDMLIVCEVKARSTADFGMGLEAVDENKQERLVKGARYLLGLKEFEGFGVRFDVASIDGGIVTYIENAFTE